MTVLFLRENTRRQGTRSPDLTGLWKCDAGDFWASAWWQDDGGVRIIPGNARRENPDAIQPKAGFRLKPNEAKVGDRDPDFTGHYTQDADAAAWASAWWQKDKNGDFYLKVIEAREQQLAEDQHPAERAPAGSSKPMSQAYRPTRSNGAPPPGAPGAPPAADPKVVAAEYLARGEVPPAHVLDALKAGAADRRPPGPPRPGGQPSEVIEEDLPF